MTNLASHRSTVLVLHQDPLLSAGLVAILHRVANLDVYACSDGEPAGGTPAADVVIADYGSALRLLDGVTRGARGPLTRAKILVLTAHDREVDIRRAMKAGVHGYLVVGGPLDELIEAVSALAKGGRFVGRSVAQRIADSMTSAALTRREDDVLRLIVTGESNKAIARQLDIEVGTVKSHVSTIMTKLGATSRTQAAGIATTRGLIDDEDDIDAMLSPLQRSERFQPLALVA